MTHAIAQRWDGNCGGDLGFIMRSRHVEITMIRITEELRRVSESYKMDGSAPRTADLLRRAEKEIYRLQKVIIDQHKNDAD